MCHHTGMNKAQAIQILSAAFGAYRGTCRPDFTTPQERGMVWHRFGSTIIEERNLLGLAKREERKQAERLDAIADLVFG